MRSLPLFLIPLVPALTLGLPAQTDAKAKVTESKATPQSTGEVTIDELPGYYEFYMKTGSQRTLRQERARDQRIESGQLGPVIVNKPLPPLSLPLSTGENLNFHDFKGEKNLVIVSYRSWW